MPDSPPAVHSPASPSPGTPPAVSTAPTASPGTPPGVHVAASPPAGVTQEITLTITGTSGTSGSLAILPIDFLNLFGPDSYLPATITGILGSDDEAGIAARIRAQLAAKLFTLDKTWGAHFDITGTLDRVVITRKVAAANVGYGVSLQNVTTTGITFAFATTREGVAGGVPTPPSIHTAPTRNPGTPPAIHPT